MNIIRWIALIFIPFILVIRHFAKKKSRPRLLKALIVAFFVCFVAYMALFLKYNNQI